MDSLAVSSGLPFRGRWRGLAVGALAVAALATSCSSAEQSIRPSATTPPPVSTTAPVAAVAEPSTDRSSFESTLPRATVPVTPGASLDAVQRERRAERAQAAPIALTIASLGVDAPVRPVGVEPSGEMEIPAASDVGWYRFGSRPGDDGSAVLAAHVDYDGEIGAFYQLGDGQLGDTVEVEFSDGSTQSFVVTARQQYEKSSLPFDEIFRRDGPSSLVLITCGGDFNPSLRSYEDNIVLFAEPA